jgi:hypothetical protein
MSHALVDKHNNAQNQLHLPKIVHPALRVQDTSNMNISARSVSRASSLGSLADKYSKEKQYDKKIQISEKNPTISKRYDARERTTENRENQLKSVSSDFKYVIPEGVNVVYTPDINKLSMPVFGIFPFFSRLRLML